jgi:hypothetical protein
MEQEDLVKAVVCSLAVYHLCYFIVFMYDDVGYLMISDLKCKAEAHSRASLMSCPWRAPLHRRCRK